MRSLIEKKTVLAEGKSKSYADYEKQASVDFLKSAVPGIKKIAGGHAEKVRVVSGVIAPHLSYEGQDASDIDLSVIMSVFPSGENKVKLIVMTDRSGSHDPDEVYELKKGVMTTSFIVNAFHGKFGR